MRTIKFRAWGLGLKEPRMFSAEELGIDQMTLSADGRGFVNVAPTLAGSVFYGNKMIPLQYTGLKDKHGKEIYEGDVVAERDLTVPDIISVVEWGECQADDQGEPSVMHGWVVNSKTYGIRPLVPYSCAEVIGNTYENPKLVR